MRTKISRRHRRKTQFMSCTRRRANTTRHSRRYRCSRPPSQPGSGSRPRPRATRRNRRSRGRASAVPAAPAASAGSRRRGGPCRSRPATTSGRRARTAGRRWCRTRAASSPRPARCERRALSAMLFVAQDAQGAGSGPRVPRRPQPCGRCCRRPRAEVRNRGSTRRGGPSTRTARLRVRLLVAGEENRADGLVGDGWQRRQVGHRSTRSRYVRFSPRPGTPGRGVGGEGAAALQTPSPPTPLPRVRGEGGRGHGPQQHQRPLVPFAGLKPLQVAAQPSPGSQAGRAQPRPAGGSGWRSTSSRHRGARKRVDSAATFAGMTT